MTFDEWWDAIPRCQDEERSAKLAWNAATAAERERCAKACEAQVPHTWRGQELPFTVSHFADAIRKGE